MEREEFKRRVQVRVWDALGDIFFRAPFSLVLDEILGRVSSCVLLYGLHHVRRLPLGCCSVRHVLNFIYNAGLGFV